MNHILNVNDKQLYMVRDESMMSPIDELRAIHKDCDTVRKCNNFSGKTPLCLSRKNAVRTDCCTSYFKLVSAAVLKVWSQYSGAAEVKKALYSLSGYNATVRKHSKHVTSFFLKQVKQIYLKCVCLESRRE